MWVWESELKDDLAKLKELVMRKKKHHLHIKAGGFPGEQRVQGCL